MYVKKLKGRPEPIWMYHRFCDDIINELYPSNSISNRPSSGTSRITDLSQQENPINCLAEYTATMGKLIADAILSEAMEQRIMFKDENKWEQWWRENFRQ